MELIGIADEQAFKKRTKLTVMSSIYYLTVFGAPYGLLTILPQCARRHISILVIMASAEDELEVS
jgi:nitrate/nitrite transporter NarK